MTWRLLFLAALWLPELPLHPASGDLPMGWPHLLGTDSLGRDGLLRLLLAAARSFGFASAVALIALALALPAACGKGRPASLWSALRALPPLLVLLPLAAAAGGLGWPTLALVLAGLEARHLEAPLRARLEPFRASTAKAQVRLLGAGPMHRLRTWAPWLEAQTRPLLPTVWIDALWAEATLRLLGLGPGPQRDSLGLLLQEELPRLATEPGPLALAALLLALGLGAASNLRKEQPCR